MSRCVLKDYAHIETVVKFVVVLQEFVAVPNKDKAVSRERGRMLEAVIKTSRLYGRLVICLVQDVRIHAYESISYPILS